MIEGKYKRTKTPKHFFIIQNLSTFSAGSHVNMLSPFLGNTNTQNPKTILIAIRCPNDQCNGCLVICRMCGCGGAAEADT